MTVAGTIDDELEHKGTSSNASKETTVHEINEELEEPLSLLQKVQNINTVSDSDPKDDTITIKIDEELISKPMAVKVPSVSAENYVLMLTNSQTDKEKLEGLVPWDVNTTPKLSTRKTVYAQKLKEDKNTETLLQPDWKFFLLLFWNTPGRCRCGHHHRF